MWNKKKAALILAAAIAAGATGCGYSHIPHNDYNRFKVVETYRDGWEIVDKDTGYGYYILSGRDSVIPLYDEYGAPYKENGWRDEG